VSDLTILEKYPKSFRIDHKDFGDVYKTTFAKGVITDVQKVQDDPILAQSQVKVTGDFGESDWLPLFFHPKAQYWDPDSQKFNEGPNYHEKAWMSFRGDDEVAVMLKEGTPVAVMAFADGVPRIGEAILEVKTIQTAYWNVFQFVQNPDDNGPDGKPLNLKLKAEKIKEVVDGEHPIWLDSSLDRAWMSESTSSIYVWNVFFHTIGVTKTFVRHINMATKYTKYKVLMHLVKIGPILYLICTKYQGKPYIEHETHIEHDDWDGIGNFGNDPQCSTYDENVFPWGCPGGVIDPDNLCYHHDSCPQIRARCEDYLARLNANAGQWNDPGEPFEIVFPSFFIYAAIYTKKLYDQIKHSSNLDWDWANDQLKVVPEGFLYQQTLSGIINWPQGEPYGVTIKAKDDIEYYFRPHTKEELQAAGMWPNRGN
jgi:hypothetical protein